METRKMRKARIVEQVKHDKKVYHDKIASAKTLGDSEKKAALIEIKNERKQYRLERKNEIKNADKSDKKKLKKEYKIYKKVYARPLRATAWTSVATVLALLTVSFAPMVSDILHAVSGKDITMNSNTPEGIKAREAGDRLSEKMVDEGIVLMNNKDNNLPLQDKKINVFGTTAHHIRYGGGGSGAGDVSRAIDLFDAFEEVGIEYNEELKNFYGSMSNKKSDGVGLTQVIKGFLGMSSTNEPSSDNLSQEMIDQAKAYSEDALIVITSTGTEASDFTLEQLKVSDNLMGLIEKVAANFENVTIVVNAGNTLELGFVEELPSVKSVVWMGTPGPFGPRSLANVLKGNINPSGRLTDTYAYDASSSPASENFGDYKYKNLNKAFIEYQEGIYVGYRFYETYFLDDEAGYQDTVLYSFGHGLSYTNFEWDVVSTDFNSDTMNISVRVTNVGDVAGKDVVQMYYGAPYIPGGLEKSAIELGAYAKTKLLEAGESEILTLSFDTRDMASYDVEKEQAYVMDEGDYTISLSRHVHDHESQFTYTLNDKVVFKTNSKTDVAYENRFDYVTGDVTYLSRNDWEGTYPNDDNFDYLASVHLKENIGKVEFDNSLEMPDFDKDNGIQFEDLKGLDINDPKWDEFLDQWTLDELYNFVARGAYKTMPNDRLGVPQTLLMDGPAGFSYFFGSYIAAGYPSELIVASTWNDDLVYEFGKVVGEEAKAYGIQGWYAPAMNLHRTAQGGRNFEYFSEDPLLSGKISASITRGAQDQGVIVFMKHFVMNDQEANARSGIVVWAHEQAMRELYLKPFEITVKEADVKGAMSSFSYLGEKWAGANTDLLYGILRDEWGFEGFVSSDAVFGFMEAPDAIVSGNDLMLDIMSPSKNIKRLKKAYKENPSAIAHGMRTSTKHVLHTMLQSNKFD